MRRKRRKGAAWLRIEGDAKGLAWIVLHENGAPAAQAAALLADLGGQRASDALLQCVRRHNKLCRSESYDEDRLWPLLEAVRGLGRLRERRAVPLLCRLLGTWAEVPSYLMHRLETTVLRALVSIGASQGTILLLARLAERPGSEDIELVGELRDPDAVVPLLALLWNMLSGYDVLAVYALGTLRDARTAPALLYLAESTASSPELRRAALEALVKLPGEPWNRDRLRVNATLEDLGQDPDWETARLVAVLQARTEYGRGSLINRLHYAPVFDHRRVEEEEEEEEEEYPSETACVAACAVIRENPGLFQGADLHPVLSHLMLATTTPRAIRRAAAEALGALSGEVAVDSLLDALGDDRIGEGVAVVLAKLPEPPARQLLGLLADASNPGRRRGAAVALGLMGCADAGPLLLEALDAAGPRPLRAAATDALGLLGHRPAAGPLGALVTDEAEVRSLQARAVRALGLIGAPESLTVLLAATDSSSEAVRLRATEALGGFSTTEAVTRLGVLAGEGGTDIARAAVQSMSQIGTPAVLTLSALIEHAPEWPVPMQRALVAALAGCQGSEAATALGCLADGRFGEELQISAVEALGDRQEPQSVAPLVRFLDNPGTRHFQHGLAVSALARIDDEAAVQRVVAHFEDQWSSTLSCYRDQAREALGIIAAGRSRPG
ncbi:HEAT repeat domain-containing protein [Streptomyces tubercidicus]|uniref:HEAT repeat domain-containing protein n=1 Tax=Streptomyces tubercidicus TaxID=47759 RepID=UPI0036AE62AF